MPFINTKTSTTLTKEQEAEVKKRLGKAIELIPGKIEKWLMLAFEPETSMYFHGNSEAPMAFVEVSIAGEQPRDAVDLLTAELTKIYSEVLGILPENIYITYRYVADWGWNGTNF